MRRRLRKVAAWGMMLFTAILIGSGFFLYFYVTDNENLRTVIREGAPRFLPDGVVGVHRVRVRPYAGAITLAMVELNQAENGGLHLVGNSPWVELSFDPWAMLEGRFNLREVLVAQPRLRIRRRADGSWNLLNLLADPWPLPPSETSPPIHIKNGTVEFVDEADGPDAVPAAILRDVSVEITSGTIHGTPIRFEGTAKGDLYESIRLSGTIDRATGRVALAGDLNHLSISQLLLDRLPAVLRPPIQGFGLKSGELDVVLKRMDYDPKAPVPLRYELDSRLRSGLWKTDDLPFSINELSASLTIRDGVANLERAQGHNGSSTIRASGTFGLEGPTTAPFHLGLDVEGLELDDRLREWSSRKMGDPAIGLWRDFSPKGRVDLDLQVTKTISGGKIDWSAAVGCRDVALLYKEFKYPLERVSGEILCRPEKIIIDAHTLIAGKPVTAKGTVDRPGPEAVIQLEFRGEALPIDQTLLKALPPDAKTIVDSFKPAGTVRGKANITRTPKPISEHDPKGHITFSADLDINPGGEITWDGLKYPVNNLTGHLELRPTSWTFTNMKGKHGQATINGEGRVDRLGPGPDQFKTVLHLNAENLLFEDQLRDALPSAWSMSWATLNPTGSSDVDVQIAIEPKKPPHYHLEVTPRPLTNLRLRFERATIEDDPGGNRIIEMPMEGVSGRFVYDDGKVTMTDGAFLFRNAPVRFGWGEVQVFNTGQFSLSVKDLRVEDFRLDAGLRKLMPPVMAQFALQCDDGRTFNIRTDLALGWSGRPADPATCAWGNGTIVFLDNSIKAGPGLKHLQGQLDHLSGSYDGKQLSVKGALDLESVNIFDLQLTSLTSPLDVSDGKAKLSNIQGTLMGGRLLGRVEVGLEATPKFEAHLSIENADLQSYAKAIDGKQTYRGLLSGKLDLTGLGHDMHSLQGSGSAHVTKGDLGKLPVYLRFISALNLAKNTKTAFDKADIGFEVQNGRTTLDPIYFFGNAFSLDGRGTLDVQGDLDINLKVIYGRDSWHIPIISPAFLEASGQFFVIHVGGSAASPIFRPEPFPKAADFVKSLSEARGRRAERKRR